MNLLEQNKSQGTSVVPNTLSLSPVLTPNTHVLSDISNLDVCGHEDPRIQVCNYFVEDSSFFETAVTTNLFKPVQDCMKEGLFSVNHIYVCLKKAIICFVESSLTLIPNVFFSGKQVQQGDCLFHSEKTIEKNTQRSARTEMLNILRHKRTPSSTTKQSTYLKKHAMSNAKMSKDARSHRLNILGQKIKCVKGNNSTVNHENLGNSQPLPSADA